jgi:hypothetical protein
MSSRTVAPVVARPKWHRFRAGPGGTGRLTGQRGFYFYARWGAAPVTLDAFRLLSNT